MPITRRKRKISGCEEFESTSGGANVPEKASKSPNKVTKVGVGKEVKCGEKRPVGKNKVAQKRSTGKKKHSVNTKDQKRVTTDNIPEATCIQGVELKESQEKCRKAHGSVNKRKSNRKGKKHIEGTDNVVLNASTCIDEPSTSHLEERYTKSKGGNSCTALSRQSDDVDSESNDDDFVDVDSSFDKTVEPKYVAPKLNKKSSKVAGVKTIRKSSTSGKTEIKETDGVLKNSRRKQKLLDDDEPPNKTRKRGKPKLSDSSQKLAKGSATAQLNCSLLNEDNVATVLLRMEGQTPGLAAGSRNEKKSLLDDTFSSEEESDWEEVKDHPGSSPIKSQLPSGPVQIRLEVPDIMKKKRKKKSFDWKAYCTRLLNRFKKNLQIQLHKVHLLCLMAHGIHCSRLSTSPLLRGQALSLIPPDTLSKRRHSYDLPAISRLTKWFVGLIAIYPEQLKSPLNEDTLMRKFAAKVATEKELVLLFFIVLSVLGLDVRLVMALHPMPLKAVLKDSRNDREDSAKSMKSKEESQKSDSAEKRKAGKLSCSKKENKMAKTSGETSSKYFKEEENAKLKDKSKTSEKEKRLSKKLKDKPQKKILGEKKASRNSSSRSSSSRLQAKNSRLRAHASKVTPGEDLDSDVSDSISGDSDYSNFSDEQRSPPRVKARRKKSVVKTEFVRKSDAEEITLSSDEFDKDDRVYRSPSYSLKKKYKGKSTSKKVVSSDSDEGLVQMAEGGNVDSELWLEVHLETERKWICVDVIHNIINKPEMIERWVKEPMTYVLTFSKEGSIKDVTPRYASKWMSHTRKLQVDSEWLEDALAPYRGQDSKREELEDMLLKAQLLEKPMPTSIGEFKNHPLYVLGRHLLKFEAIYPETAVPLDFIRKEPIYARECVHTLHSRENWLKEGRVVKQGQTAYKMVKSRPKWNKPKENPDELDLELFGEWQTEIYIPPPAQDGKIFRNEYGNIELFKPSMLPEGTVHIRIDGLKKVAKKLDIDCVPAMVGWDHHSGRAHPILDGCVVCKEHEDVLLSAWEEDQEIQRQKEIDKKHKRIYGNWKILVRGLIIRERLKQRFDLENAAIEEKKKVKKSKGKKATDTELSWPRNRQDKHKDKATKPNTDLVEVEQL